MTPERSCLNCNKRFPDVERCWIGNICGEHQFNVPSLLALLDAANAKLADARQRLSMFTDDPRIRPSPAPVVGGVPELDHAALWDLFREDYYTVSRDAFDKVMRFTVNQIASRLPAPCAGVGGVPEEYFWSDPPCSRYGFTTSIDEARSKAMDSIKTANNEARFADGTFEDDELEICYGLVLGRGVVSSESPYNDFKPLILQERASRLPALKPGEVEELAILREIVRMLDEARERNRRRPRGAGAPPMGDEIDDLLHRLYEIGAHPAMRAQPTPTEKEG